jgi:hypothetical protein
MKSTRLFPLVAFFLVTVACSFAQQPKRIPTSPEPIGVSPNGRGFVSIASNAAFHPWGMNYGHGGLIEDFWAEDWDKVVDDLRKMKDLGANVARMHLQFGRFMAAPDQPNRAALAQLSRLLRAAEETGIYLDLTGLGCYRPSDVPPWYDGMAEPERWSAQANFWAAVAEAAQSSPAVFCYDLINEPCVPGEKREAGRWRSGHLFGGYDFVQFIALDPAGRSRDEIAVAWTRRMTAAIRAHDKTHMITIGMLPWSRRWGHLSGFVPERMAPELDFVSVHLYPDSKIPGEALEALEHCVVGKPVVIEESFPLNCTPKALEEFMRASRKQASGWMLHYDGETPDELDARERAGKLTIAQAIYRDALRLFVRLKPEFSP